MANQQKFDFDQAEGLKNKLQSEIAKIESDLKRMATMVEGVKSWWSGGSEEAFIANFQTTKGQVVTSLNKWIEDYKQLIGQIAEVKRQSDADLASKLKI
ncbi:hypothetical protein J25TS5_28190 [Paenibacillus faecis]|uniref:WXG100 family type VII secretion target n=1 Tax=Paenibacillus faecis TaxID=862114 RepID=A0A5D0D183_9BACL|nr:MULTISPECIES: WXG100 family type VII secretion target [Paenibacillus]MCA1293767.1 WXG100 family type VII secretion target [Paenibacillus sp. alder61]TYA15354.1 hypothetical protein FRY98_06930 [Paenibacillus faecis]GIO85887.1 hypothetical protein J25TS5_28190 [Paenibacillus faecis]